MHKWLSTDITNGTMKKEGMVRWQEEQHKSSGTNILILTLLNTKNY